MYLLALMAGIMLWRNTRLGRILSLVVQLIQLPKIASTSITFLIGFGFDFAPTIFATSGPSGYGIGFNFIFGAEHRLLINNPSVPFGLGFSLVSCVSIYILLHMQTPEAVANEP